MNLTSLYYFSELCKDLHMTKTAARLYISQQTLSNHIQRLEEYYGLPLFYRKPTLSLTYAGEIVLAFAENINQKHQNLKDVLADIQKNQRGVLRFGASSLRLNSCLPNILPAFSERYPNIEIRIQDTFSMQSEALVLNGDLDFAIILSESDNPSLSSYLLMQDQAYLCVTDALLHAYYGSEAETLKKKALSGAFVKDFAKLPFCILSNRLGRRIQKCFEAEHITPKVYMTSAYTQISTMIGLEGLAAFFAPQTNLVYQRDLLPKDINIFPLNNSDGPIIQQVSLIHHKGRYLSHYAKYFLDLLFQYYADVEHTQMERMV